MSTVARVIASRRIVAALLCALALIVGCAPDKEAAEPAAEATVQGPEQVKLLVVDDPDMATAIEDLRAEWKARTGTTLVLTPATSEELLAAERLPDDPDGLVYPSRMLGALIERKWIAALPAEFQSNRELAWRDNFELLQIAATTWDKTPYAVPFGSPLLTLYYRPDVLAESHKNAPRDWHEYHELADLLGRRENLHQVAPPADAPWHGSLQPLGEGWAARVLLARAAAYVRHRDHFSTLFDIETMKPLIAGAGFQRALEELLADYRLGPPEQIEMDPAAVREAFLAGQAAFALTWPGHAAAARDEATTEQPSLGFAELPGSPVMYNFANETWEKRQDDESWHVPTLALAGRMGSIVRTAREPRAALQVLAWLSGREWGPKVSSASPATTLYRVSQVRAPQPWLDRGTDAEAAQSYAAGVQAALSRRQHFSALRIPGEERYMAALDEAVRGVLRGEKSPAEALQAVADQWRRITEQIGREKQTAAYRASVGL